jgi:hypothetical protein
MQGGARACSWRRLRLRRQFLEEEEVGRGPHGSERRGWRRLGRPEAKAWWGGRLVADQTGRAKKGKEAGPKPFLGLKSNRVKENQF